MFIDLNSDEIARSPLKNYAGNDKLLIEGSYEQLFQYWNWVISIENPLSMYKYFVGLYDRNISLRCANIRRKKCAYTLDVSRAVYQGCSNHRYALMDAYIVYPTHKKKTDNYCSAMVSIVFMAAYLKDAVVDGKALSENSIFVNMNRMHGSFQNLEPVVRFKKTIISASELFPIIEMSDENAAFIQKNIAVEKNIFNTNYLQ
jgi:hypothetical protein